MPALNFQEQFAQAVASGEKRQTIRRARKRPIKPDDRLFFFTEQRSANCTRLGEAECREVEPIRFETDGSITLDGCRIWQNGMLAHALAVDDGFRNANEMVGWFTEHYGLPFEGVVIRW